MLSHSSKNNLQLFGGGVSDEIKDVLPGYFAILAATFENWYFTQGKERIITALKVHFSK